jgi:hypothetical protein
MKGKTYRVLVRKPGTEEGRILSMKIVWREYYGKYPESCTPPDCTELLSIEDQSLTLETDGTVCLIIEYILQEEAS